MIGRSLVVREKAGTAHISVTVTKATACRNMYEGGNCN